MLLMSFAGAVLTLFLSQTGSALAGTLALYLTVTAWMTVRSNYTVGYFEFVSLLVALCLVASGVDIGLTSADNESLVGYVLAGVAAIAAGGDLRLLIQKQVQGRQRVARHLWRLSSALLIATATVAASGSSILLFIAELAVLMALILWIIHLRIATTAH
jgi:hypothetical protein